MSFAVGDCSYSTALNYAMACLNVDMVKYLLGPPGASRGANPWLRDINGRNAFDALLLFCENVDETENKLKLFESIPKISVRRDFHVQFQKKYQKSRYVLSRIEME